MQCEACHSFDSLACVKPPCAAPHSRHTRCRHGRCSLRAIDTVRTPGWASGVVQSNEQTTTVPSASLQEKTTYVVRVRVTTEPIPGCVPPPRTGSGSRSDSSNTAASIAVAVGVVAAPSAWSEPAYFDVGLAPNSWSESSWIGGARRVRAQFNITNPSAVGRARVYVVGLGAFVLHAAGSQVGDHYCDPPEMAYPKRTASVAHPSSRLPCVVAHPAFHAWLQCFACICKICNCLRNLQRSARTRLSAYEQTNTRALTCPTPPPPPTHSDTHTHARTRAPSHYDLTRPFLHPPTLCNQFHRVHLAPPPFATSCTVFILHPHSLQPVAPCLSCTPTFCNQLHRGHLAPPHPLQPGTPCSTSLNAFDPSSPALWPSAPTSVTSSMAT
jgi:hypothetical protein